MKLGGWIRRWEGSRRTWKEGEEYKENTLLKYSENNFEMQ